MLLLAACCVGPLLLQLAAADSMGEADRQRHLQLASGLIPEAERLASKYNPTAGTLPPFPNATAGTFFSGVFGDHVVLQREPAKAAIYGVIFGAEDGTTVTVDVGSASGAKIYSVPATVMLTDTQMPGGRYAKWKAYLKPSAAGGNFTVAASCASCKNSSASSISDVTFGDVWFCSGKLALPGDSEHDQRARVRACRRCAATEWVCAAVVVLFSPIDRRAGGPVGHCRSEQHVAADEHGH